MTYINVREKSTFIFHNDLSDIHSKHQWVFGSEVPKKPFSVFFFYRKKRFIHSDLISRVNNLVGYNLPDSYLGIPLSIFTINITLGNKNIKQLYNQVLCLYYSWSYTIEKFQTYLAYCYWCLSVLILIKKKCRSTPEEITLIYFFAQLSKLRA